MARPRRKMKRSRAVRTVSRGVDEAALTAQDERPIDNEMSTNQETTSNCTASCNTIKKTIKKTGRGHYRGLTVEKKTNNGKEKLEIEMATEALRPVGENARDLVNYCGYIVRNTAHAPIKKWEEVAMMYGQIMWRKIQEFFVLKVNQDDQEHQERIKANLLRMQNFCLKEMQEEYRQWKARLSKHYKRYKTDAERLANPPKDMPPEAWKNMMEIFGSEAFQKKSMTNSANKANQVIKHTTGPISFVEKEYAMRDPNSGELPDAAHIWMVEHTREVPGGGMQWVDAKSKEIHEELEELICKQAEDEANSLTQKDMLLHIFGPRSGYFIGKGSGWKGHSATATSITNQKGIQELEDMLHDVQKKMEAEQTKRVQLEERIKQLIEQGIEDQMEQIKRLSCMGTGLFRRRRE